MLEHSDNYNKYVQQTTPDWIQIRPDWMQIRNDLQNGQLPLADFSYLLREMHDAKYGICSQQIGNEWVRDATKVPDKSPITPDDPKILHNLMIQRVLGRYRAIEYALRKTDKEDRALPRLLIDLLDKSTRGRFDSKQLNDLEKTFNSRLLQIMHKNGLTGDIKSRKEGEKLLFHYRNLSALLDKARPMVTITHDKKAGIYHRETHYPVTEKMVSQKEEMKKCQRIYVYPGKLEKNWHSVQGIAQQKANQIYYDKLIRDDTMLPAQARKSILPTTKNTFIVKVELFRDKECKDSLTDPFYYGRTGSPVYIGKGAESEAIQEHTVANLQQIAEKLKEVKQENNVQLHALTLNTNIPYQQQTKIVEHMKKAVKDESLNESCWSYVPTNIQGSVDKPVLAKGVTFEDSDSSHFMNVEKRADYAAKVAAHPPTGATTIVNCASGQDRTSVVAENVFIRKAKEIYANNKLTPTDNIAEAHARGGSNAEITTWMVAGSPGIKESARPVNLSSRFFQSAAKTAASAGHFYNLLFRTSARTNKKNPLNDTNFLAERTVANEKLNELLELLQRNQRRSKTPDAIANSLQEVIDALKRARDDNYEHPARLVSIAQDVIEVIRDPDDLKNTARLENISHAIRPDRRLEYLGSALLVLAGAALVTAGILAAVPTGGTSLLMAAAGAVAAGLGVSAVLTLGIGATAIGTVGLAGLGMLWNKREKSLKEALGDLHKSLPEPNEQPTPPPPESSAPSAPGSTPG